MARISIPTLLCSPGKDDDTEGLRLTPRDSPAPSMPPRSRPRRSLSEWYQVQAEDGDGYCSSPSSKRKLGDGDGSSFFIGDDIEDCFSCSPVAARAATASISLAGNSGNAAAGGDDLKAALRCMCAEYFENNISPMLRYIQQAQEGLNLKVLELREALDQKASVDAVPTAAEIEASISREVARKTDGVATFVRLQELGAAMQRKAEVTNVPSLAQMKGLADRIEQKANNTFVTDQVEILATMVKEKANNKDVLTIEELKEVRAQPFLASSDWPKGSSLSSAKTSATTADEANLKRVQVVVAAAAARFDKQLRDVREQLSALQDEFHGAGDRWPGRTLNSLSNAPASDGGSDSASAMSFPTSAVGSDRLGAEERVELKKIQTVVAAAGTTFSRDMREVRKQVHELRNELSSVKGLLHANANMQS